ncbi:hypothetical protein QBC40DRAFT_299064 [Triangularia verruculosa]|uniref:Uncharacterized protein n=1 Tax=Triangularia verruculosa TaxID=2587418 RepID=A0AAN7ASI1_9PEZI|nr:hypothetical protein QBC40DRAFT_299064 [Triangularia verruculosa]
MARKGSNKREIYTYARSSLSASLMDFWWKLWWLPAWKFQASPGSVPLGFRDWLRLNYDVPAPMHNDAAKAPPCCATGPPDARKQALNRPDWDTPSMKREQSSRGDHRVCDSRVPQFPRDGSAPARYQGIWLAGADPLGVNGSQEGRGRGTSASHQGLENLARLQRLSTITPAKPPCGPSPTPNLHPIPTTAHILFLPPRIPNDHRPYRNGHL